MWLCYNLFQPVMRLTEKVLIRQEGRRTRIKRRYDTARTPFDRLCDTTAIRQEHREQLQALRDRTNPRELRQEIYDLIDEIFSLPGALPGITEAAYQTLSDRSAADEEENSLFLFAFNRTTVVQ